MSGVNHPERVRVCVGVCMCVGVSCVLVVTSVLDILCVLGRKPANYHTTMGSTEMKVQSGHPICQNADIPCL